MTEDEKEKYLRRRGTSPFATVKERNRYYDFMKEKRRKERESLENGTQSRESPTEQSTETGSSNDPGC
jgi:hypothetical protein